MNKQYQWIINLESLSVQMVEGKKIRSIKRGFLMGGLNIDTEVLGVWGEDILSLGQMGKNCFEEDSGGWNNEVPIEKSKEVFRAYNEWIKINTGKVESKEQKKWRLNQWKRVEQHDLSMNTFKKAYADGFLQAALGVRLQDIGTLKEAEQRGVEERWVKNWSGVDQLSLMRSLIHQWKKTEKHCLIRSHMNVCTVSAIEENGESVPVSKMIEHGQRWGVSVYPCMDKDVIMDQMLLRKEYSEIFKKLEERNMQTLYKCLVEIQNNIATYRVKQRFEESETESISKMLVIIDPSKMSHSLVQLESILESQSVKKKLEMAMEGYKAEKSVYVRNGKML